MTQGHEFDWNGTIQDSGPQFITLPAGDYNFTITKFERARHQGSTNLPPCHMAILHLEIDGGEHGTANVIHRLFLHSKTEGFLSRFFEAIGQKKENQPIQMNWNIVFGAKGRCKLIINKYTKDGQERENNQVDSFLPYEEYMKHAGTTQQYQPQQQQQQQSTQQHQAPFPTGQPQQQQQPNTQTGGYVPGQF
ncbi:hypothetical protein AB4Y30_11575 [Ornithinibacillus sp. 4-3]|uniref:DUF669 domain-containing protein n=1 Tax=Ornithinibacillus sp. 4-3 TaxID=3231488 RepID=A0AB39HHH3_9BACI